jgi:hypothetical protein
MLAQPPPVGPQEDNTSWLGVGVKQSKVSSHSCHMAQSLHRPGRLPGAEAWKSCRGRLMSLKLEATGHGRALSKQVQAAAPGNYCSHVVRPAQMPSLSPPTCPDPPNPTPTLQHRNIHLREGLIVEDVLGAGRERHVLVEVGVGLSSARSSVSECFSFFRVF